MYANSTTARPVFTALTPAEQEEARALRDELLTVRSLSRDFDGAAAGREALALLPDLLDLAAKWDAMAEAAKADAQGFGIDRGRSRLRKLARYALADDFDALCILRGLAMGLPPRIILNGIERRDAA